MKRGLIVIAGLAGAHLSVPAMAQVAPVAPSCGNIPDFDNRPFIPDACLHSQIDRQIMANLAEALPAALARSFGLDAPDDSSSTSTQTQSALLGDNLRASPVADVPVTSAATTSWNIWGDGKFTYDDASLKAYDQDGPLANVMGGIDYKLSKNFTMGVMVSGEGSDLKGPWSSLKTSGIGIGPYIGYNLNDHIVLSSSLIGSVIRTDQSGFYHYDSHRLLANTAATGYWYFGALRVTPAVTFSWSKEWLEETHHFLPDHSVEIAMLTPSLQLGRSFKVSDRTSLEPWLGAALDWSFVNRMQYSGLPSTNDPTAEVRLQAGMNMTLGPHAQLAVTGEMGGIVHNEVRSYAAEANLAIQF